MKKLSIIALAALAMISCGNTYRAQQINLSSANDSVNYALGLVNGAQVKMYQMAGDTSDKAIAEFIDALQRGYDGKTEELSEVATVGRNIGQAIKSFETKGLVEQPAWQLNEKIFFQGLVNGLLNDTAMMLPNDARQYFQTQFQTVAAAANDSVEVKVAKPIKGKCGKVAKTIALNSQIDSINYAFGAMNGDEIRMYVLAQDSTGEDFEEFVKAVNTGLKSKVKNPQLVAMGENIGKTIKEQEANGLVGVPQLITDFELIKQGFINGLYGFDGVMPAATAGEYIQTTIANLQFGENKKAGEQFLAENALKDGVVVTESGLQYEVLKMGKGPQPTATDRVKVHYHGTLIDGTVFDSSVERGEPITFALNQVIAGWTEGVQLMPVGSKFRFYIPQELGYGAREAGSIPAYSTLIFEVELLGIEK